MSKWIWVVTTYKPSHYLKAALDSIPENEDKAVIDLSTFTMKSLAQVWNKSIKEFIVSGAYDTVIVCNDDIKIVRPDTGEAMHYMLHGPAAEMDGVMINAYDTNLHGDKGYQFISGLMPSFYQGHYWGIQPGFFCFAVGQSIIDNVGWFDEKFKPCFYEDMDMIRRIAIAQKTLYVVAPVEHVGRGSWKTNPRRLKVMEKAVEKSRQRYIEKWGGDMGTETYVKEFNK